MEIRQEKITLEEGDSDEEVLESSENSRVQSGVQDDVNKEQEVEEEKILKEQKEEDEKELGELLEKQKEARSHIEERSRSMDMVSVFKDLDGEEIPARKQGKVTLKMLNIEEEIIQVKHRFREDVDTVHGLQDSIRRYGLIEPVHVVPYGNYYILLQGYRRLQAYVNLGKQTILALVDYTVPAELAKYYQVELNNVKGYRFIEKLNYGNFVEETQPNISVDVIEQSLGLKAGEYLKMKYIEQFKTEFAEIFMQVQNERLSIEQAYKKIDKEIEKRQKELEESELESEDMEDLRDVDELSDLANDINQQELGKRRTLDPVIRRSIESRAGGECECCGYGRNVPDLMGAFQVHHIVPVQYSGDDSKGNLILLCHNCHALVHDYETGRFTPEQETYDRLDDVKKIVVLGNMLRILRKKALHLLRTKHVEVSRQVDKGVVTLGQGILKANTRLKWEEEFEESPYSTFIDATENLRFGGTVKGEYSQIADDAEEEESVGVEQVQREEDSKEDVEKEE